MKLALMKPPWIPQDDLLLKNAVEAGASLESLAKGAVQFSRKYTVTELRDRWQSLLYDPDISAEASASMVSLELPGPGAPSKSSGNAIKEGMAEGAAAKRKVKSIRRQYYAMRKKICRQLFDSFDMGVHDEMNIGDGSACENNAVQYDECHVQHCMEGGKLGRNFGLRDIKLGKIGDGVSLVRDNLNKDMNNLLVHNLVGYGNYSGLEEVGPSQSMSEVPLWKSIEDIPVPAMPVQVSLENKNHATDARVMLSHDLKGKCANDVLNASIPISGEDATHLSDSLLNLTPEDEPLFMEIDGKDATDKPCYDNLDSLLLNSPGEIQGNDAPALPESRKSHTENTLAIPSRESAAGLEDVANPPDSSRGERQSISDAGNDVQSFLGAQSPSLKLSDEFMYCTLNTEDPDIPSNDNIDPSVVVPYSVTLKSQPINKEVGQSDCSIDNNQREKEPKGSLKKEDTPSHSFTASQIVRPVLVSNINPSHPPVGVAVKIETAGRNPISAVPRQSNNVNINPIHSRSLHATMMPASDEHLKPQETNASSSAKVNEHSKAAELKGLPKSEANSLSLNQEGDDDDDDNNDDDDDNGIPNFSDAETMILEMDLDPTDQDLNATREVSMYQDAETKKTIMRLEQCAQSFFNRAIASQGAFALLYGRKLKQYIKKSEVILGRATDDVQVDIDLGREGRANKISRRQALIRMEANGSFVIKNLGKSSIFLNGKEVATGQLWRLAASSLIEIRGLSFVFEINKKSVERFLENLDRTGGTLRRQW